MEAVERLPDRLKDELLILARQALECAGEGQPLPAMDMETLSEQLSRPGASFVTLTLDETLRGCIGTLEARMPLAEDVSRHAYAAALHDIRFPPVSSDEVGSILIEISVLSEPTELKCDNSEELLSALRPGIDGVIISEGEKRATFLPQVWERIPSPSIFLSRLCEKAGLHADRWTTGIPSVQIYEVESFQEKSPEKR
jgi:AmmeMemoRadiSam system protein A